MQVTWKGSWMLIGDQTACFLWEAGAHHGDGRRPWTITARVYATPEEMGQLTFGIQNIEPAGPDHALMLGSWQLNRSGGWTLWRGGSAWYGNAAMGTGSLFATTAAKACCRPQGSTKT